MSYQVGDEVKYDNVQGVNYEIVNGPYNGVYHNVRYYDIEDAYNNRINGLREDELTLIRQIGIPCPITANTGGPYLKLQIGDNARYYGHTVKVLSIKPFNVYGEQQYEVETTTGTKYIAAESELLPLPSLSTSLDEQMLHFNELMADTNLPKGSELKGNGCECGAWTTTYKDDHMTFCPKFKDVK